MRQRSPPIITHQWIFITSAVIVFFGLLLPCCQSATATSHLRHRQHGGRDDLELGGGVSASSPEPSQAPAAPQPTAPYRMPEVAVRQHQQLRLNCELQVNATTNNRGRGGVNLVWLRNDEVVSGFDVPLGHRYAVDRSSGQLSVANARLTEDEGVWQCVDRDPQTGFIISASGPVRVIVLEPPRALYLAVDGRRLDPGNLFLPVKEDTELSVVCIVEGGHPEPQVTWLLVLAPGTEERVSLNTTELAHSSSEAHLGRVMRAHHNATVTCLVNHETLQAPLNASLLLDVQYSPSFGISRIPGFGFPIREGIAVSLRCDVDSNPPSSPVWVKDDGAPPVPQSGDGFLNFTAIRREHSGWYKCTSRHLLGEFSSIGYFLNVRSDEDAVTAAPGPGESTAVEVSLGGAVQLQCPGGVGGCWSRVGATGGLEPVGPGPQHTIDRVLYQEAGKYHCVLPNRADPFPRHWRESPHVEVSVVGRPVVYLSNKTLSALYGQTLKLTVEYCANPPASRALWLTERKLLAPGDIKGNLVAHNTTAGSSFHCHHAVLTVRDVTPLDQGEYVFLVRSPRGLAEGSVLVNVTGVSSYSVSATRAKHKASTMLFVMIGLLHRFFYKQNYMLFI